MNSNILVPHEFFKKSKKEYNNWLFAFFRELIQNSVDAKATELKFTFEDLGDEIKLTCFDNGCGMDRETLINTLLCLGGSKKSEDSIGGFGYAKTLLFFAHKEYEIKSKNQVVIGTGGSYGIHDGVDFVDGTHVTILMDKHDEIIHGKLDEFSFRYELKRLLSNSNTPKTNLYWNDELLTSPKVKFDFSFPTTIGKLKFSENNNSYGSVLWVRVNGLAMFEHTVYGQGTHFSGILDLDKKPTDVLTSNRDALKGDAKNEFNKIIESLQNERSALKSESTLDLILNPTFYSETEIDTELTALSAVKIAHNNKTTVKNEDVEKESVAKFSPFQKIQKNNEKVKEKMDKLKFSIDASSLPTNFVVKQGDENNNSYSKTKSLLNQSFSFKLAHSWKRIVYSVLNSNTAFHFIDNNGRKTEYNGQDGSFFYHDRPINVGFCFDDSLAVNLSDSRSIRILLNLEKIKEMKKEGKLRTNKILDLAFHEISHIFVSNHNDNFCSSEMSIKWDFYDYYNTRDISKINNLTL